jgi:large conductance mechanosensitive channel
MLKEFREFAMKGNVLDLAIGVVIGAAFSKIIDSVVKDLISPIVGAATGGIDFSAKSFKVNGVELMYGNFLTAVINFVIVAFVLFMIVKVINRLKRKEEPAVETPAEIPADVALLGEIRDLLKTRSA